MNIFDNPLQDALTLLNKNLNLNKMKTETNMHQKILSDALFYQELIKNLEEENKRLREALENLIVEFEFISPSEEKIPIATKEAKQALDNNIILQK